MAVANFLTRVATAASQVLHNYQNDVFEKTLFDSPIGIAFDSAGWDCSEGRCTLDLLVRLMARLYPTLVIKNLTAGAIDGVHDLQTIAISINPEIALESEKNPCVYLVVGETGLETDAQVFYLGSDNWLARFSSIKPLGSRDSNNPLGAGAAACFGAANVFRKIFASQLPHSRVDTQFNLCLLNYSLDQWEKCQVKIDKLDIGEVFLAGAGAIGNSFAWATLNMDGLRGKLHLVDGQEVDLGNLQRYVLTTQESVGRKKVDVVKELYNRGGLEVVPHPVNWGPFLESANSWNLSTVAVAVDTSEDRIAIQSSLPRVIFNAWTQTDDLGVSRHLDFINKPCLSCLYLPSQEKQSYSQEVAANLGLRAPQDEEIIRNYLALNKPLDQELVQRISSSSGIDSSILLPYLGESLEKFYGEIVCGKMMIDFGSNQAAARQHEVPLAFQSALAGILLAAEVLKSRLEDLNLDLKTRTRFNLLKPISKHNSENCDKLTNSNCICQDEDYRNVFMRKYGLDKLEERLG